MGDFYGGRGGRGPPGGRFGERGGGGRGDFGGGGRGDIRGRGDFGGRGRGRGREDFGARMGGGRFAPEREAGEGTAARPGRRTLLLTAKDAEAAVEQAFARLPPALQELASAPRARRPGHGRAGRTVKIIANHFPVKCRITQAMHYDVAVEIVRRPPPGQTELPPLSTPLKLPPREVVREVIHALAEKERWPVGWAFDGVRNIYSPTNFLPQHEEEREVTIQDPLERRRRDFKVRTKWVANVNIGALFEFIQGRLPDVPQDAIQALDVALKQSVLMHPTAIVLSRAVFFPDPSTTGPLPGGAEVWIGYTQSARPCENGLTLNVDMACTAFLQEVPVPRFLVQAAGLMNEQQLASMNPQQRRRARKAIAGLQVEVTHMGAARRKYRVKDLTDEGADRLTFFNEQEGREMTVQEYFEQRYHMQMQMPQIPCLNVGTPRRPTYLPAEVCRLAKGQRQLKLDERQAAEMIKVAAKKPPERMAAIMAGINEKAKLPTDPTLRAWEVEVSPNMLTVDARQLEPPGVQYQRVISPGRSGEWNLRGVKFFKPSALTSYGVASFVPPTRVGREGDPGSIMAFVTELLTMLGTCGLTTPEPFNLPEIVFHQPSNTFPGETLDRAFQAGRNHFKREPDLLFVLLPDTGAALYKEVKCATDSFLGVASQCFVARKASIGMPQTRPRDQYLANLSLKINAKLDGINQISVPRDSLKPWQQKPFIVIGADVSHSMTWQESEPSIASLVGSLDRHATQYSAFIQLQGHNIEVIQNLKSAMRRLLLNFYNRTNKMKPERIIFFRDGVSEGQFRAVQRAEVPQIIACCQELGRASGEDYSPPVTYIVCQKRHNTRLLPRSPNEADRSGNVPPGTIVDNDIVHPVDFDFYLNSHGGLLGTNRPAHYNVLLDQNGFQPDELQAFIYNTCYQFARCTRSVSMCPPAYYAHLAAARGRCMLSRFEASSDTESLASGPKIGTHAEFAPISPKLATKMFYI